MPIAESNPLRDKLNSGKTVVGIWSIIPSPALAEVIGRSGMDFQILDMEHGPFDWGSLADSVRASEAAGCSPLVRVASLNGAAIQSILDTGAHGIVVPQMKTVGEVDDFLAMTKFGPAGRRGLNPFTRAGSFGLPTDAYPSRLTDTFPVRGVLIENIELYNQLDQVLAMPDLDLIYLGVYDISVSMGIPGQTLAEPVISFVRDAAMRARSAGKSVCALAKTEAEIEQLIAFGVNMIVWAVDTYVIGQAMRRAVDAVARVAG